MYKVIYYVCICRYIYRHLYVPHYCDIVYIKLYHYVPIAYVVIVYIFIMFRPKVLISFKHVATCFNVHLFSQYRISTNVLGSSYIIFDGDVLLNDLTTCYSLYLLLAQITIHISPYPLQQIFTYGL